VNRPGLQERTTTVKPKKDAVHESKRAMQLLAIGKDAMNGPKLIEYLTVTYAYVLMRLDRVARFHRIRETQRHVRR
jgi:hypothetical protein